MLDLEKLKAQAEAAAAAEFNARVAYLRAQVARQPYGSDSRLARALRELENNVALREELKAKFIAQFSAPEVKKVEKVAAQTNEVEFRLEVIDALVERGVARPVAAARTRSEAGLRAAAIEVGLI